MRDAVCFEEIPRAVFVDFRLFKVCRLVDFWSRIGRRLSLLISRLDISNEETEVVVVLSGAAWY